MSTSSKDMKSIRAHFGSSGRPAGAAHEGRACRRMLSGYCTVMIMGMLRVTVPEVATMSTV
jgi:hypothetical protein